MAVVPHHRFTQRNSETPPSKCVTCQFPIGLIQRQKVSSVQKLLLNKTQDSRGQHKGKMGPVSNMEVVEENRMKGPIKLSPLTTFIGLAGKDRQNETPKEKSQKLVFEESLDIVSANAPVKALQKPNPDYVANTVQTDFNAFTGVNKLRPIPVSLFYHSSRARTAAFPEPSSASRSAIYSVTGTKKHKRLLRAGSYSQNFSPSNSKTQMAKRRKVGEINVGVYHRIKKCKKKLTHKRPVDTAQCKIMPEDRKQLYLEKVAQSITDTKNSVYNEKAVHFTPRHAVQPCLTGSRMKSSFSPLTPNTVELICPASPLPFPDKVAHSIADTENSVYNEKDVHFTLRHSVQPCLTGSRMRSSSSLLTPNTVELTRPASPLPDPRRNIKLKVSNGKFSHSQPETILKAYTVKKVGVSESYQTRENDIFAESSAVEVMQETVRDNVEFLLKEMEESPKKDNLPAAGVVQSPNHYSSSVTTALSSLAIHDEPLPQFVPQTSQTLPCPSDGYGFEASTEEHQKESLFMEGENTIKDYAEKENHNKYFPVFYKSSETLEDVTKCAKKRPCRSTGNNQHIIDAGRKKSGATQFKECGFVHHLCNPEDDKSYEIYYDNAHTPKFTPCTNERVVAYYGTDKVILIKPNDPKSWLDKVKIVKNVVDKELGYVDEEFGNYKNSQIYLYVLGKQVIGCVVAHSITFAYKMFKSIAEDCDFCSVESYPAKFGVSRVWVDKNYRRKKIASRLMDCVRSNFIPGHMVGMDEFAFSAPTVYGKAFAEKYTGTVNYLVIDI